MPHCQLLRGQVSHPHQLLGGYLRPGAWSHGHLLLLAVPCRRVLSTGDHDPHCVRGRQLQGHDRGRRSDGLHHLSERKLVPSRVGESRQLQRRHVRAQARRQFVRVMPPLPARPILSRRDYDAKRLLCWELHGQHGGLEPGQLRHLSCRKLLPFRFQHPDELQRRHIQPCHWRPERHQLPTVQYRQVLAGYCQRLRLPLVLRQLLLQQSHHDQGLPAAHALGRRELLPPAVRV